MSEAMRQVGKITFNAWALDGYVKVFWRDLPVAELAPELTVLGITAIVLFGVARLLARRWESS
jgi:ABC-2 type transport system permease protein